MKLLTGGNVGPSCAFNLEFHVGSGSFPWTSQKLTTDANLY